MKRGDVVIVEFPYVDGSRGKNRPSLALKKMNPQALAFGHLQPYYEHPYTNSIFDNQTSSPTPFPQITGDVRGARSLPLSVSTTRTKRTRLCHQRVATETTKFPLAWRFNLNRRNDLRPLEFCRQKSIRDKKASTAVTLPGPNGLRWRQRCRSISPASR